MYFTSNDGSASEMFAEHKIGDNWQIAPGHMFFNGPKDSRLGQFKDNDMVYFNLKYSFQSYIEGGLEIYDGSFEYLGGVRALSPH